MARPKAAKPKAPPRKRAARKPPPPAVRPLSLPALRICKRVLEMQTLDVSAPDFDTVAMDVIQAKGELGEQIAAAEAVEGKPPEDEGAPESKE